MLYGLYLRARERKSSFLESVIVASCWFIAFVHFEIEKKLSFRFDITDALKDVVYEEIYSREDALIKKLASFIEDPLKEKTNRQRKPVVCKKISNIVIFINQS